MNLVQNISESIDIHIIASASRKRNIDIASSALAGTNFVCITNGVRVRTSGVSVKRHVHHVIAVIENLLCSVAMVIINIEYNHFDSTRTCNVMSNDGCVVEEAVSAVQRSCGVVPWGPAQTVRRFLTIKHQLHCSHCCIYCTTGCFVRAFG